MSALIDFLQETFIINDVADNRSDLTCCVTLSYQIPVRCLCFFLRNRFLVYSKENAIAIATLFNSLLDKFYSEKNSNHLLFGH